jgi:uncharacterized protein YqjF (DUF2071 family)
MPNDFNYDILDAVSHRPWPMPDAGWIMTQTWNDLLFAHWPVEPRLLASKIPAPLMLDQFDGQAWIGIVPFRMTNVAPRGIAALPGVSAFPELNVRTYVTVAGKPGVYFFSLDAGNRLAVLAARTLFRLPYYSAAMKVGEQHETVDYSSRRKSQRGAPAQFLVSYRPAGPVLHRGPGTLEHFLTERYCLYTVDKRSRAFRLEIHHLVWPLQPADADIRVNTMTAGLDIGLPATTPLLHFAKRQNVVAWLPTRIAD